MQKVVCEFCALDEKYDGIPAIKGVSFAETKCSDCGIAIGTIYKRRYKVLKFPTQGIGVAEASDLSGMQRIARR
jgi:hypothetical protein